MYVGTSQTYGSSENSGSFYWISCTHKSIISIKEDIYALRLTWYTLYTVYFIIQGISQHLFRAQKVTHMYVISLDTIICKEISEIANILLNRLGAHTKGWQARVGQQESPQVEVLSEEANHISSALKRVYLSNSSY